MDATTLAVVVAIISIVGSLTGVVVSALLTMRADRLKWEREHQTRRDEARLQVYIEFMVAIEAEAKIWGDYWMNEDDDADPLGTPEMNRHSIDAWAAVHKVAILTRSPVKEAADDCFEEAGKFVTNDGWSWARLREAEEKFQAAVKTELQVHR